MQKRMDYIKTHAFLIVSFGVFAVFLLLLLCIPLFHLIWSSFHAQDVSGLTLQSYRRLFESSQTTQAFANSLSLSFWSSAIAMALAVPCAMAMLHI